MGRDKDWAPRVCAAWARADARGELALFDLLGSGWLDPGEEAELRRYLGLEATPPHLERPAEGGGRVLAMWLPGPVTRPT